MHSLRPLMLACVALILGASAPVDPSSVRPGTYAIEPTHARVLFAVDHFGISTWYGDFTRVSGTLHLDPKNPGASRVDITIPIDTLSTTNAGLDATLKGADWFDAAKFPVMTFKSNKVTLTTPNRAEVAGDLTLHGVTRPILLEVTFRGTAGPSPILDAYMIGFDVRGRINRSDFGIRKYPSTIGDDVDLIISAPFSRKGD